MQHDTMPQCRFILYLAFLTVTAAVSEYTWGNVSRTLLAANLFDYELCVLDIAERGDYDYTVGLYEQPLCQHLSIPSHIPRRCYLGMVEENPAEANPQTRKNIKRSRHTQMCMPLTCRRYCNMENRTQCRGFISRLSFWKHWQNLEHLTSHQFGAAGQLISTLHKHQFHTLMFIGDSISIQTAQHLACRLLRSGATMTASSEDFFNAEGSVTLNVPLSTSPTPISMTLQIVRTNNELTSIDIEYEQCAEVSSEKDCVLIILEKYKNRVVESYRNIVRDLNHTAVISNQGLHGHHSQTLIPYIHALLDIAKSLPRQHNALFFRETMAQHYRDGGMFNRHTYAADNCCYELPAAGITTNWYRDAFLKSFYSIAADFHSNGIGYIPAYELSKPWYDLHVEGGDCTHFAYHPFMMDALWHAATLEMNDFLEQ